MWARCGKKNSIIWTFNTPQWKISKEKGKLYWRDGNSGSCRSDENETWNARYWKKLGGIKKCISYKTEMETTEHIVERIQVKHLIKEYKLEKKLINGPKEMSNVTQFLKHIWKYNNR